MEQRMFGLCLSARSSGVFGCLLHLLFAPISPSALLSLVIPSLSEQFVAVFGEEAALLGLALWPGSYQKVQKIKGPPEEQDPPLSLCFPRLLPAGTHHCVSDLWLMTRRNLKSVFGEQVRQQGTFHRGEKKAIPRNSMVKFLLVKFCCDCVNKW